MGRITWAILVSGFVAVVAQTLIIRETLTLFGGNELVSGIVLSFWLIWGGVGSIIFSNLKLRYSPRKMFAWLLIVLSFLLVFSLFFLRIVPRVFNLPLGEVIDLGKITLIAIITLAPTCMVFGALFPAASRILPPERVYLIEGLGAFIGGVVVSFLLIQILPPFGIMLLSVGLMISVALLIDDRIRLLFIPLLLLVILFRIDRVELFFRRMQMGGPELIGLRESKYGVVAVTKSGDQFNFYTNGLYDFSYPDLYSSEEAVHYALLLHFEPREVLVVGGGIGNSITEVLKHPSVEEVTYVELDPILFDMGEKYLGEHIRGRDELTVIFGDARYYVKNASIHYDVIIVNLPDPVNAQINRFYTEEFFAEAKRILNPEGILSVRITAPPNIISPLFGQLLNTVRYSLSLSFANIVALPLAKTTFIASDYRIPSHEIAQTLRTRINDRNLGLTYVRPYYFDYDLSQEKLDYLNARITESKSYANSDLKPVCYYFTSILWGGLVSENLRRAFVALFGLSPVFFLLPLGLIFFFYRRKSMVYVSVMAVGASEISAEVILIVLFQVFYGYLYGWIGAIIACYMLGLAVGTICYLKLPLLKRNPLSSLVNIEFALVFYFLLMIVIALTQPPLVSIIIPFMVFIGGLMGGMHFPVSIAIISRQKAGFVYGVDLVGSSIGALVTAMILLPILGIVFTLAVFSLLNCLVGIGLITIRTT